MTEVVIHNHTNTNFAVDETTDTDGNTIINITMEENNSLTGKIEEIINSGSLDRLLNNLYGIKRRGY